MKFYYVKLSCPAKNDDNDNFGNILNSCINKKVLEFNVINIPFYIKELNVNDLVIFILSGDTNDKRKYFKNGKEFENGIYAISVVKSIDVYTKSFKSLFYPLNNPVSREDLYYYTQFTNNIGASTKSNQNQAGLHKLETSIFYAFIDFLVDNNNIDLNYQFLKLLKFKGYLNETLTTNQLYLNAKKNRLFKKLDFGLSDEGVFNKKLILEDFYNWCKKGVNLKKSYEKYVDQDFISNKIDKAYFAGQLFLIDTANLVSEISRVKNLIAKVTSRNSDWQSFNLKHGNGIPSALIGENNYLKFLNELISNRLTPLPKPFLLLAGISGTGKSRFVKEQARLSDPTLNNFCMLSVRPDWHEPSDLLGYVSRIPQPHYVVSEFLLFVIKAWKNAFESANASQIVCKTPDQITPFWLCLDEMNLAPVEQYFADYLSVLETRQWDDDKYSCDPLLKASAFNTLDHVALRESLGLADSNFNGLWDYFKNVGIPISPNLIVAGTVNMDETTHGFSRKVIDRALTIDFGAFFPNQLEEYFAPTTTPIALSFPVLSKVNKGNLAVVVADSNGKKSISFLESINDILGGTPFELAYRALNELLISVVCFEPKNELELHAVWDDFLMTKVLPRLEGDSQKLKQETTGNQQVNLLTKLQTLVQASFNTNTINDRPDLLRVKVASKAEGEVVEVAEANIELAVNAAEVVNGLPTDSPTINIPWRSISKLDWMNDRLKNNGFTSYWP